jgi:hypothetical protein
MPDGRARTCSIAAGQPERRRLLACLRVTTRKTLTESALAARPAGRASCCVITHLLARIEWLRRRASHTDISVEYYRDISNVEKAVAALPADRWLC